MTEFTSESYIVCSYCECPKQQHAYFWSCPLLEKEQICIECCLEGAVKAEAVIKFEEITEVKRTREQIDEICRGCGKRPLGETI